MDENWFVAFIGSIGCLFALAYLAIIGAIIFVVIHFVAKYW